MTAPLVCPPVKGGVSRRRTGGLLFSERTLPLAKGERNPPLAKGARSPLDRGAR